jgi:hypothetical protein
MGCSRSSDDVGYPLTLRAWEIASVEPEEHQAADLEFLQRAVLVEDAGAHQRLRRREHTAPHPETLRR